MLSRAEAESARQMLLKNLADTGYQNAAFLAMKLETAGYDVLCAEKDGVLVAVRAYLRRGRNLQKIAAEMLRLSSLAHPNIIKPKALFSTDSLVGVVTEFAAGGSLFRAVPPGGLPFAAALYIFQQLALALQFCHAYGIHLRSVSPANLLLSRNSQGAAVVKIFDFRQAKDTSWEGQTVTRLRPTPYTCPHALRSVRAGGRQCEDYGAVCDVWALAVTLYFLCFGRWPFTCDQITAWELAPPAADYSAWNDDATLFDGVDTAAVPADVCDLFRAVFASGRQSAAQYAADPAAPTLQSIIAAPWFQVGLPPNAANLWETYCEDTRRLRESHMFRQLDAALMRAVDPFGHGDVPPAVLQGMPPQQRSSSGSPVGSGGADPAGGGSRSSSGGLSGTSSAAHHQ